MSTTDEHLRTRAQSKQSKERPSSSALRLSGAIRLVLAVLLAGGITAGLIVALWGPLHVTATVVGYPIYYDFNPYNYSRGYELTVVLFPLLTLAFFYGLTWLGPRVGLATPPRRGRLRPSARKPTADAAVAPAYGGQARRRLVSLGHVAFVGAVFGLEVAIAAGHFWPGLVTVAAYCSALVLGALLLSRRSPTWSSLDNAMAMLNALATALTLAGLVLVSAHTELTVTAGDARHVYPWCPPWVGFPAAAVVVGAILFALRRGGRGSLVRVERWMVFVVAAPVALFLLTAHLPGDLGQLGLFEEGQQTTETMLVGQGWLPWRDVFLAHGLLGDVAPIAAGWGVFGNSYWGGEAGFAMLFEPLTVVATYLLMWYLVRRSWPLVFIGGLLFVGTWLGGVVDPRYGLWPIVLLIVAALLRRPRRWLAITLGALVVAQAIVSDEMVPCVLITLAVVSAYEWYWRTPGSVWKAAFQRTIWVGMSIFVGVLAFIAYMGARGAIGAVIYDTVTQIPGHTLDGGNPPTPIPGTPDPVFVFVTIAPIAAVLISMAYAAIRLRLRRPFELADWPMGGAAIFVFFYYTKFLAVMDMGHAYQVFAVATPLMLYIVYRAISTVDDWFRNRPAIARRQVARWMPACPVAIALLAYFVIGFWNPLTGRVEATPSAYRPTSSVPAVVSRVGYSSDVDAPAIRDLGRILNAYLGPHGRIYDFTNEPGLFYYFLNHDPTNRWFAPNGLVQTPQLQNNLISDLRRERPKLIVYDDTDPTMYGLEAMQAIPVQSRLYLVSRWILDHYKPLLESHNRIIYALPSVRRIPASRLHLEQPPVTSGLRFVGQSCLWGDSPTFLAGPAQPNPGATSVPARVIQRTGTSVTLTGWAGASGTHRPAREVIVTLDGRVIGRARPGIYRPDLPQAGLSRGFVHSGFQIAVPTRLFKPARLGVYAVGPRGGLAQIPLAGQTVHHGRVTIAGRSVRLQPRLVEGRIDSETPAAPYVKIAAPDGASWAAYSWLEVGGPTGLTPGEFTLADVPGVPVTSNYQRFVAFNAIASSPNQLKIPVGNCQQWRGYGSRPLYLTPPAGQSHLSVRLVR